MRKENRKILAKIKGRILCPNCNADLKVTGIGYFKSGVYTFEVGIKKGKLTYQKNGFCEGVNRGYYCYFCDKGLSLSDEEVLKILKL